MRPISTTSALRIGASLSIVVAESRVASGGGHVRARHAVELLAGLVAERDALIVHDAPVGRVGHLVGHAHAVGAVLRPGRQLDGDADVHARIDPVGPLVLQCLVGADVEVAVLREQVLQPLVLDETVADEVPAVVALDPAVGGFALGAGLGGAAGEAAEDLAEVGFGADRAALVVGGPGDGVFADMGRGGGGAVDAAGAVVAQR